MKKLKWIVLLITGLFLSTNLFAQTNSDAVAVFNTFEKLKKDRDFLDETLDYDPDGGFELKSNLADVLILDWDGDGKNEGILVYRYETSYNRKYYLSVFENKKGKWKFQDHIYVGQDFKLVATEKNITSKGYTISGKAQLFNGQQMLVVLYNYQDGEISNIYTTLHKKPKNDDGEFIQVFDVITEDLKFAPFISDLKDIEKTFGKAESVKSLKKCKSIFKTNTSQELYYHNFQLEKDEEDFTYITRIHMSLPGISIQTDKGTITKETTLKELENLFHNKKSYEIYKDDVIGHNYFKVKDSFLEGYFEWIYEFDENGKLISVYINTDC